MKTSESFNKIDEAIFRRKELNSALSQYKQGAYKPENSYMINFTRNKNNYSVNIPTFDGSEISQASSHKNNN